MTSHRTNWVKQSVKRAVRYSRHVQEELVAAREAKRQGELLRVRHHVRWARRYHHELIKTELEVAEYLHDRI